MYTGLYCSLPVAVSTASTCSPSASWLMRLGPLGVATVAPPGKQLASPADSHRHSLLPLSSQVNLMMPAGGVADQATHWPGGGANEGAHAPAASTGGIAGGGGAARRTFAGDFVAHLLRRFALHLRHS